MPTRLLVVPYDLKLVPRGGYEGISMNDFEKWCVFYDSHWATPVFAYLVGLDCVDRERL